MDEKKFEELLLKNNIYLINLFEEKFGGINEKFEEINGKFEEINGKFEEINEKFDIIDKKFDKIDEKFDKIDKRFDEMEQKRIDDNFYFEHTYGEKISIIFDKLQMMDQERAVDKEQTRRLENKVEKNSAILMAHDLRISKLEKNINSQNLI